MKTKKMLLACFTFVSGLALAQVPTAGLLNSWDFNSNLFDGTGNGNDGVWSGTLAPIYVTDRCGQPNGALHFDGFSDYVQMPQSGPAGSAARSISFWMRSTNRTAGGQSVVRGIFNYGFYTTAPSTRGSRWEICHNYGCEGVGVDISYEYFTRSSTCVNDGKWHHIVVTQAAGAQLNQARVYIDAILMPQPSVQSAYPNWSPNCSPTSNTAINATDVGPLNPQFKAITIGCVLGSNMSNLTPGVPGRFYSGDLDDFYFYNRVLTPVEVAQLYAEKCELRPCITCIVADVPPRDPKSDPHRTTSNAGETDGASDEVSLSDKNVVVLDQNVPNPFAESTEIKYSIPTDFTRAQIIFLNDKGIVMKAIDIKQKGAGAVTVFANDLSEGIYAYNLVIDGVTIESKKMIKEN